ncbi:hypothetical protein [Reinekea sp.]|uniref:SixA phosphatase family protein n=1 Tax=Reinekea sp. TaxID=1970455 RepID=UPI002A81F718|nr:hypothetical protein [Reinekea sp.]
MRLYLMRHGEAEPYRVDDASRALTTTGKAAVASKCPHLPIIDLLVVSPYLRALQSADTLVAEGLAVQHRRVDERVLPDSNLDPILETLIDPSLATQLIIAHNPLLTRLLRHLCGTDARGINMGTAEVACLLADEFHPGIVQLEWIR